MTTQNDTTALDYVKIRDLVSQYVSTPEGWMDMVRILTSIAREKRHLLMENALIIDADLRMAAKDQDLSKSWQDHSEPADSIHDQRDKDAVMAMEVWQKEDR